ASAAAVWECRGPCPRWTPGRPLRPRYIRHDATAACWRGELGLLPPPLWGRGGEGGGACGSAGASTSRPPPPTPPHKGEGRRTPRLASESYQRFQFAESSTLPSAAAAAPARRRRPRARWRSSFPD